MVGTVPKVSVTAVMLLPSVVTPVPMASVGLAVAPLELKVRVPFRVLLPTRVSELPPLRVRLEALAIWPALPTMATVALLIVRLPGITVVPAMPVRFSVPWFTTVPPE